MKGEGKRINQSRARGRNFKPGEADDIKHLPNRSVSTRCGGYRLPATLSDDGRDFSRSKVGWSARPIECSRRAPNRDSIAVAISNCYNNAIISTLIIVFHDRYLIISRNNVYWVSNKKICVVKYLR